MSKWRVAVKIKVLYASASNRGNKKRDANKFLNGSIHGITVHGGGVPQSQLGEFTAGCCLRVGGPRAPSSASLEPTLCQHKHSSKCLVSELTLIKILLVSVLAFIKEHLGGFNNPMFLLR